MSEDLPTLEQLMEAGAHFGHIRKKWHPKMEPYIFGIRNNTHIINLEKTQVCLKKSPRLYSKIISWQEYHSLCWHQRTSQRGDKKYG